MPMMLQDLMDQLQQGTLQPPDPSQLPPGTPPNGLLANLAPLIKLGSVDQRHKLFQQQYDQAGQTAAGAPVDYSHGKGAPLALAGLVNLVSAGLGGYQQGKATGGLRDLVKEQDTTRTDAASSALNAPTPDFASLLSASPEDLPAKTQAAQQANDGRRRAGMMLSLSGDQVLGPLGKALYGDAERGQETMLGMPMARAGLAGADLRNQETTVDLGTKQRAAADAVSPSAGQMLKDELKRLGAKVPDGASTTSLRAALEDRRKTFAAQTDRDKVDKFAINPVTGRAYNVRTGEDVPGSGGAGDTQYDKRLPPMQKAFAQDFDPNINRAGEVGKNQARFNAANRVLALAVDPATGAAANLTTNQMPELAQSVASLISSAGTGAQAQIEHLLPHSIVGDANKIAQWVTNEPRGAGQQAFVQLMIDTAKREQAVSGSAVKSAQAARLANHLAYFNLFPDQAKSQLQNYGFDPNEVDLKSGRYTPKAPAAAPQTFARPQRTLNGETREWDGQKWVPIGK